MLSAAFILCMLLTVQRISSFSYSYSWSHTPGYGYRFVEQSIPDHHRLWPTPYHQQFGNFESISYNHFPGGFAPATHFSVHPYGGFFDPTAMHGTFKGAQIGSAIGTLVGSMTGKNK